MTLKSLTAAVLIALGIATGATAALSDEWLAQRVTGSAFRLAQDRWVILEEGDRLTDPFTVRTVGRGRLDLRTRNCALALGGESTISVSATSTRFTIELLAGAVAAAVQGDGQATISAGNMNVALTNGAAEVSLGSGGPEVDVQYGSISVEDGSRGTVDGPRTPTAGEPTPPDRPDAGTGHPSTTPHPGSGPPDPPGDADGKGPSPGSRGAEADPSSQRGKPAD